MDKILKKSFRSIRIVESSMKLENKLTIQKKSFSELDQQALVEYAPTHKQSEGLLVQSDNLKNPDDLEGWEVKPNSFLASCNITIMVGSTLSTAVPADKGSEDWRSMREEYIRSKELAIKEVHEETHRVLIKFLDTLDLEENIGAIDSMPQEVLYQFGNCVNKVLASLNKVVAPLLVVRMPRPGVTVLSPPPVTADPNYTEELVARWVIWAVDVIKKASHRIKSQARCLGNVLEDVKESLDAEAASAATSAPSSPTQAREHTAAIVYVQGDQPDSEPVPADQSAASTLLAGYATFYVRRADHRACQELLDRVGEAQDSFNNRGAHAMGSVAHNVLTAMRRVDNQTLKLGVHRTSLMPNEFELVRKMPLFRGALNSTDIVCDVASRLKPLLFSAQQSIIRTGTIGMGMYFVNDGTCAVSVAGSQVAKLQYGDFFGEVALTMASQRTANVEAQGLVELFEFTRSDLKAVARKYPHLLKRLKEQGKQRVQRACTAKVEVLEGEDGDVVVQDEAAAPRPRMRANSVEGDYEGGGLMMVGVGVQCEGGPVDPQCLRKLKYLCTAGGEGRESTMTEEQWESMVGNMQRVRVRSGEKVVGETLEGSFYIIEKGRVAVQADDLELSMLRSGDFFGEVRLMLSTESIAEMHAAEPSTLLRLSRPALCAIFEAHPLFYKNLFQVASRRQALAQHNLEQRRLGVEGPFERLPSAPMARTGSSDKTDLRTKLRVEQEIEGGRQYPGIRRSSLPVSRRGGAGESEDQGGAAARGAARRGGGGRIESDLPGEEEVGAGPVRGGGVMRSKKKLLSSDLGPLESMGGGGHGAGGATVATVELLEEDEEAGR